MDPPHPDQMCEEWIFIPAAPKAVPPGSGPLPVPTDRRPFRPRHSPGHLVLGGLPVPVPKCRPKSMQTGPKPSISDEQLQFHMSLTSHMHSNSVSQPLDPLQPGPQRLQPAKLQSKAVSQQSQLLRLKCPSQSTWLVQEWNRILSELGTNSKVFQALTESSHSQLHASRILDQFAPSTLLRYFSAWQSFQRTLISLNLKLSMLTESQMADTLITMSLGKRSDFSAGSQISIKAIRWISTHAGVDALHIAWCPMVESFLRSRIPKELKESIPFSLFTLAQLERRILMSSCSTAETVVIGAILACTWAGLRFSDAQRCSYRSFSFDGTSLRGSCWRTKTSNRGQPWGIQASGLLSLGAFSWVEKWLITLDQLWFTARSTDLDMPVPDYLFPRMGHNGIELPWTPMSYADALYWIRHMTALPWKSIQQSSSHWTAHSMKSTLLSWGSQMIAAGSVTQEERLLKGHHRQGMSRSLRLYSRDDVHGQLAFQSKLIEYIRRGGRFSTPLHRGAQHPVAEPNLQIEFSAKIQPIQYGNASTSWRLNPRNR